jgi:holo-[acyl-carrier protein] synthase
LRPDEFAYCFSHSDPAPFVAARFAAKEAVSKAFGTGIGALLGWQDIEVKRLESGRPEIVLHDAGEALRSQRDCRVIHLSLTHTVNYASAVAVLER